MANSSEPKKPTPPPLRYDFAAAFLSYLVPGLGQIFQGRVGKGVMFMACVYLLFFYGLALGNWSNVYLPRAEGLPDFNPWGIQLPKGPSYRVQFLGQFWVGVAAWPAIYQYWFYDEEKDVDKPDPIFRKFMRTPTPEEANELQNTGDKTWDLGWVYTVIAGVLNIMIIYDAFVGPAFVPGVPAATNEGKKNGAKDAARR